LRVDPLRDAGFRLFKGDFSRDAKPELAVPPEEQPRVRDFKYST